MSAVSNATTVNTDITTLLGDQADDLLSHKCEGITADALTLPNPDFVR